MNARLAAFVIWAAVAASAMFWALRLGASSPVAPAHTVAVSQASLPRGDLTRVFGAAPPKPASQAVVVESALASRFKLLGVAAPRRDGDRNGLALIAVDGKPARSFAVGATVDGELMLQAVHARGARIGARGEQAQVHLELPALPPPSTGTPPGLGGFAGASNVPPPPVIPVPGLQGLPPTVGLPPGVGTMPAPSNAAPVGLSPIAPTPNFPASQTGEQVNLQAVPLQPGLATR